MLFLVGLIASVPIGFAVGLLAVGSFLILKGVLKFAFKKVFGW